MRSAWLALAAAALLAGCGSATGPAVSAQPVEPQPTATPGVPLPSLAGPPAITATRNGTSTRIRFSELEFDVPAAWQVRLVMVDLKGITMAGFVGTAPSTGGCYTTESGGVTTIACNADLHLGPGDVSIELETVDSPRIGPMGDSAALEPGAEIVRIDGVVAELTPDARPGLGGDRAADLFVPGSRGSTSDIPVAR